MSQTLSPELLSAPLVLEGRIMPASNATFLATAGDIQVVYKPVAGEKPLWDFPHGTLANREIASYAVSEALGWNVVPLTFLREGPHGPGMVQVWQEPDPDQYPVDLVAPHEVPDGWRHVLDASDARGEPVSLIHENSEPLRRMALFDVIVNNADRKGGHVLAMADGHRFGVDHGVSFNVDDKLRTVLWGWAGEELDEFERDALTRLLGDDALSATLSELVTRNEVRSFHRRCELLLARGRYPQASSQWPAIPWPAF
ncbi:SCO1664 family protein [Nocardioides sp.]|uniref:SCO1664 family protein n=1 Tax=Nocardioides sp. TaxID=35761 RepID=UPI003D14A607